MIIFAVLFKFARLLCRPTRRFRALLVNARGVVDSIWRYHVSSTGPFRATVHRRRRPDVAVEKIRNFRPFSRTIPNQPALNQECVHSSRTGRGSPTPATVEKGFFVIVRRRVFLDALWRVGMRCKAARRAADFSARGLWQTKIASCPGCVAIQDHDARTNPFVAECNRSGRRNFCTGSASCPASSRLRRGSRLGVTCFVSTAEVLVQLLRCLARLEHPIRATFFCH